MVAAPKHVYSVVVKNASDVLIRVVAQYHMPDGTVSESPAAELSPNGTHQFHKITKSMGTYEAAAFIEKVTAVYPDESTAVLESPFPGVFSPTSIYHVRFNGNRQADVDETHEKSS